MLILATDKRKPSTELHSDSRIRRVSNFRRKDRILPSTKPKGKWHLKTNRVFCLLLAESQVHKLKGQDSKSVKSRRSNCRRSVSSQVVDNTKKNTWLLWGPSFSHKTLGKINAHENTDTVHKTYQNLSDYLVLKGDLNLSFLPLYKYFTAILLATVNDAISRQRAKYHRSGWSWDVA